MARISGSDGFLTGVTGICGECFAHQRSTPHPDYYYGPHDRRLALTRKFGFETFIDVEPGELSEFVANHQEGE